MEWIYENIRIIAMYFFMATTIFLAKICCDWEKLFTKLLLEHLNEKS